MKNKTFTISNQVRRWQMIIAIVLTFLFPLPTIAQETHVINIGLLIQDKNWVAAKNGAEMAIIEANKTSSKNRFELVVKSMEGAWGAGGNEAINLIFDDKVIALVGSHDGRNAHLIEQAATKSGVVFVSAWAGDPTLSQAFIPWFFNAAPNNSQQSETLFNEIYGKEGLKNITLIADDEYDSKTALKSFSRKVKESGMTPPEQVNIKGTNDEINSFIQQIRKSNTEAIILFIKPATAKKLVSSIHASKVDLKIFAPLLLLNENEIPANEMTALENLVLVSSNHWYSANATKFRINYLKLYGMLPGNVAAYTYDAVQVLTQSITMAGTEREMIQKTILEKQFNGVTGSIKFDDKGKRIGKVTLVKIHNGIPVEFAK